MKLKKKSLKSVMLAMAFLLGAGGFLPGRGPAGASAAGAAARSAAEAPSTRQLYDDFSSDAINPDLWEKIETGLGSTVTLKDGRIFAQAVNNRRGDDGEAGLRFKDSSFQAFQVDAQLVSFKGEARNCRIYLKGKPYNFIGRNPDHTEGEISVALFLRADGRVKYYVYACEQQGGCYEDGTFLFGDTLKTVDPKGPHTLGLGFDGQNLHFRIDAESFRVPMDTIAFPVATPGWRNPHLRSDAKGYENNMTSATFDNVFTGSVRSIMTP